MTAIAVVEGRSARGRRPARAGGLTRVSGLGLGVAMPWFSLLVLIPLTAVVVSAAEGGWSAFWSTINNEQTAAAIALTVGHAPLVTGVNQVMEIGKASRRDRGCRYGRMWGEA